MSIAHRGASAYAPENSLDAFALAADLGADMWEVDLHQTADGNLIAFHDFHLADGRSIASLSLDDIRAASSANQAPLLTEVIALAQARGCGLYADIKATNAAAAVSDMLQDAGVERAILGAFDPAAVRALQDHNTPYPIAALVPVGVDPFDLAVKPDILHLCWEKMDRPQDLLDQAFFARCAERGQKVVLWHEEDPARMAELRRLPVLGICSDRPELVNPVSSGQGLQIVCHRGANKIAPENTLSAAHACFAAGFSHVEIDVHVTSDDELVVLHDPTLDRTTNGHGRVGDHSLAQLRQLSAGGWFSQHFAPEKLPTLDEMLDLAKSYCRKLYIELKSAPADLIWNRVCAHGMQDRVFFWSFVTQSLLDLRGLSEQAHIMARRQDFDSLEQTLETFMPSLVEFTVTESWADFPELRRRGIPIMIAYGGEERQVLERIAAAAPDMVNLDQPFLFAQICREKGVAL
ncbi:glycerophosphodiester phosphodiesterase family protein [Phaeobacter sp.]|uniref:glycerophosphodiester phosphodiesterase family protein n=1 Tax=Phaeobacter sp. TaxID=1902409 RepID=UPI0025FA245C|nr:glycerophosphodiester phosphodiesterase family protein [Phaeobacter sp.]